MKTFFLNLLLRLVKSKTFKYFIKRPPFTKLTKSAWFERMLIRSSAKQTSRVNQIIFSRLCELAVSDPVFMQHLLHGGPGGLTLPHFFLTEQEYEGETYFRFLGMLPNFSQFFPGPHVHNVASQFSEEVDIHVAHGPIFAVPALPDCLHFMEYVRVDTKEGIKYVSYDAPKKEGELNFFDLLLEKSKDNQPNNFTFSCGFFAPQIINFASLKIDPPYIYERDPSDLNFLNEKNPPVRWKLVTAVKPDSQLPFLDQHVVEKPGNSFWEKLIIDSRKFPAFLSPPPIQQSLLVTEDELFNQPQKIRANLVASGVPADVADELIAKLQKKFKDLEGGGFDGDDPEWRRQ